MRYSLPHPRRLLPCLVHGLVQPALHGQKTVTDRLQGILVQAESRQVHLVPGLEDLPVHAQPFKIGIVEKEMILGGGGEEVLHHVVALGEDDPSMTQWISLAQRDSGGGDVPRQVPMVDLTVQEWVFFALLEPSDQPLQARTSTHQGVGGGGVGRRPLDGEVDPGLLGVRVRETEKKLELIKGRLPTGGQAGASSEVVSVDEEDGVCELSHAHVDR